MDDTNRLLLRTNLTLDFEKLLQLLQRNYPDLGRILSYKPLTEGYDNANFKLKCSNGGFVLKIFSKPYTIRNIQDNILVHSTLTQTGVPVPKILNGETGELFLIEDSGNTKVFATVTEFFEGENFVKTPPSLTDIKIIIGYLRKINSAKLEVAENYDSWGTRNLVEEYAKKERFLNSEQKQLIKPVVDRFKRIDFPRMPKALIHGDLQRKHVFKNPKQEYLIIDFGCVNFDPRVLDLAIFLALFCFDEKTWQTRYEIFEEIRYGYLEPLRYTDRELEALPTLIKATYSIYLLNSNYLQFAKNDNSEQTAHWYSFSSGMLKLLQNWHKF